MILAQLSYTNDRAAAPQELGMTDVQLNTFYIEDVCCAPNMLCTGYRHSPST
jgi:hypothetical protein